MDDKRWKGQFYHTSNQQLTFTKEDRQKVFQQLRELDQQANTSRKLRISSKKWMPITISILVASICLFLFLPSILNSTMHNESNSSELNSELTANVLANLENHPKISTAYIAVKSKEMEDRIYLNLLFSYHREKKMLNVVSIPSDTYVQIAGDDDGTPLYDKLLFAYRYGGAENTTATISSFFNLPIDHFAIMDIETISTLVDSVKGIDYEIQQDFRARGILQAAIDFQKGTNHLNGEQLVSLLIAATDGNNLGDEDLSNLLNKVLNKEFIQQLNGFLSQIETNASVDSLLVNPIEIQFTHLVSLNDGMISDIIKISDTEGKHIYRFDPDFIKKVSQQLMSFN